MKFKISLGKIEIVVEKLENGKYKATLDDTAYSGDSLSFVIGELITDNAIARDIGDIFLQYGKVEDEE